MEVLSLLALLAMILVGGAVCAAADRNAFGGPRLLPKGTWTAIGMMAVLAAAYFLGGH